MNRRTASFAALASAVLGCWLPSLWLAQPPAPKHPPLPGPPSLQSSPPSRAIRDARSPLALFQAIAATGRTSSFLLHPDTMENLRCQEAEDLARSFAAEDLGRRLGNGTAFLESLRSIDDGEAAVTAIRAWADNDPENALALLLKSPVENIPGGEAALTLLVARNPAKALAILNGLPGGREHHDIWGAVLAGCAEKDLDFALKAIRSAPPDFQLNGVKSVVTAVAAKDPRAALDLCQTLEPPALRRWAHQDDVFRAWAKTDPAAALQEYTVREGVVETNAGYDLALTWARQEDPDELYQWALQHPDTAGRSFEIAAREMARQDPPRALTMVSRVPPDYQRNLLWDVGKNWVQQDPAAAVAWSRTLPEEQRSYITNGMIPFLTPDTLRTVSAELGLETSAGFGALFAAAPDEALQMFSELSPAARINDFGHIVFELKESGEFARAAAFAADYIQSGVPVSAPGELYSSCRELAELTGKWAAEDPAAASAWVDQLPAGPAQNTAAANLALTWGRYDLPSARAWVEQIPVGLARDKAAEQITRIEEFSGGAAEKP